MRLKLKQACMLGKKPWEQIFAIMRERTNNIYATLEYRHKSCERIAIKETKTVITLACTNIETDRTKMLPGNFSLEASIQLVKKLFGLNRLKTTDAPALQYFRHAQRASRQLQFETFQEKMQPGFGEIWVWRSRIINTISIIGLSGVRYKAQYLTEGRKPQNLTWQLFVIKTWLKILTSRGNNWKHKFPRVR